MIARDAPPNEGVNLTARVRALQVTPGALDRSVRDTADPFELAAIWRRGKSGWNLAVVRSILPALSLFIAFATLRGERVNHAFPIAVLAALALWPFPPVVVAQENAANVSVTAPLENQYVGALTALHDKVIALANAIPGDKYSWRPSAEVRSVAQVLTHIAGEWFYLCPRSVAGQPPPDFTPPGEAMRKLETITAKSEVLTQLNKSWEHCRSVLSSINPSSLIPDSLPAKMGFPRVVLLVLGDQHEHLGQLIAYARSIGVKPPWSQ